ncbi:hypothetical protein LCGC14_2524980 [marine sediment metagenome]|uniref:Uncharacterized protein n=1 Tax=marine sediment metagenome TaxID=412755 RepID=A0A0F9BI52_9ZZZZ
MSENQNYSPIEVAVAMALYGYNVNPADRAAKIYNHFKGHCAELYDLVHILSFSTAYAATELAMPSAALYVQHALEKYGEEARNRVKVNMDAYKEVENAQAV